MHFLNIMVEVVQDIEQVHVYILIRHIWINLIAMNWTNIFVVYDMLLCYKCLILLQNRYNTFRLNLIYLMTKKLQETK